MNGIVVSKEVRSRLRRQVALLLALLGCAGAGIAAMESEYAVFDESGRLIRPEGYRRWVFLGAPVTPNDMNSGKAAFPEFHNVYIDPASFDHYAQTGEFREGTILVKELVSVGSKQAASGNGYFAGDFIGLEATVKSRRRLPEAPGNWGYFRFTQEAGMHGEVARDRAEAMPTSACNSCHEAGAAADWVFSQYYPVLRASHP